MLCRLRFIALLVALPATAVQAQVADTIFRRTPLFTPNTLALAGGFAAAGAAVAPLDRYLAHRLQDSAIQSNGRLQSAAAGFRFLGSHASLGAGAGLYLIGRASGNTRTADLGLHSLESMLIGDFVGAGMKALFGRARPYANISNPHDFKLLRGVSDDKYRSFPSGHTINAFAFASTVSRETVMWWPRSRWHIGPVMYGGATLVGISRMYHNQHWASDVVGGAAIGTIVGLTVVRYHHSHPGNKVDRTLLSVNVTPSAAGERPHISLGF